jgi:hypothetical protein
MRSLAVRDSAAASAATPAPAIAPPTTTISKSRFMASLDPDDHQPLAVDNSASTISPDLNVIEILGSRFSTHSSFLSPETQKSRRGLPSGVSEHLFDHGLLE